MDQWSSCKKRTAALAAFTWIEVTGLLAQSHSESPYSDQAYDPIDQPEWYETPLLWIGMIIIALLVVFYLLRRGVKHEPRKFMGGRREER